MFKAFCVKFNQGAKVAIKYAGCARFFIFITRQQCLYQFGKLTFIEIVEVILDFSFRGLSENKEYYSVFTVSPISMYASGRILKKQHTIDLFVEHKLSSI